MGLDMYLEKRMFVKNFSFTQDEERYEVVVYKNGQKLANIDPDDIEYITMEAMYWRKANAIHKFFVDTVQDGIDNCGHYWVSKDTLQKLYDKCKQVKENKTKAHLILPTEEGFFFGSTDYNEGYFQDIDYTIEFLEAELPISDDYEYFYHSSW
jgi:hypothetical protein